LGKETSALASGTSTSGIFTSGTLFQPQASLPQEPQPQASLPQKPSTSGIFTSGTSTSGIFTSGTLNLRASLPQEPSTLRHLYLR